MKVLILGSDGYIGFPLSLHLKELGHEIRGVDNCSRRMRVSEVGSNSLIPINDEVRKQFDISTHYVELGQSAAYNILLGILIKFQPDTIVHLAEQPSAPWSMVDCHRAAVTQQENVIGTLQLLWAMKEACPSAHLVKLGSMGEYGTPNCDIPEGMIPEECTGGAVKVGSTMGEITSINPFDCPLSSLPFPKSPNSFYHLSKVHDTNNIIFACKTWGLTSTDIMQGIVFGVSLHEDQPKEQLTRFDYDQYFGTVINRFCAQAISRHPLTIYGSGQQTRGFLSLTDSIQCLTLAIENPPKQGEYRTFNQFENTYSVFDLAKIVINAAFKLGLGVQLDHIPNPRVEKEDHYYNPTHQGLLDLSYKPTTDIFSEIIRLISDIIPYGDRVIKQAIMPTTKWK